MSETLTVIATAPTGLPYSYTFSDMGNFNEAGSAFDNPVAVEALQLAHAILSMEDGSYTKGLLGRISMTTEGTLTINESRSWSYTGEVRSFNDTFDANFDPSRGEIAQASTTILSWFPRQPFPIELPGTIPVKLSGQR